MWRDWLNGILGIMVVITAYLGIPLWLKSIFLIVCGIIISFVSFGGIIKFRIGKEVSEYAKDTQEIKQE